MIISRLPISTNNQNLPLIDESKIGLTSPIEPSALAHWILDGGVDQYISRVKSASLSVVGAVSSAITGVTTDGASGYLLSDVKDPNDEMSILMVVKIPPTVTNNTILASNFKTSPTRGALFTLVGSTMTPKLFISDDASHANIIATSQPVAVGEYAVIAASKSYIGTDKILSLYSAGLYKELISSGINDINSEAGLSFGWFSGASNVTYSDNPLEISEIVIFDSYLNESQLADAAYRARIRCNSRGISVVA